ncbi:MAG: LysE family transporter [Candidatus Azobacteroides pseudotrichonymphae]|nr:LysE family translocator [Bacteroidales bacterium OttesenSCG-928-I14]GMO35572.1 MAG: LysE family transporter [Candidatus Azobacteroides pseudotrichonymphae]
MQSCFTLIYKGLIIGVLVSVPVGPVGLLCIQRTLYKGRWYGFSSGLGAAFSDFLYAIIVCTSMGIVGGFIEKNRLLLQILGSILLIVFSIYAFLNSPFKSLEKTEIGISSYSQNILSVFLLSFSNPFVVFLYISLFNSFGFLAGESLYVTIMGAFCVFMGNLLWWFVITYLVSKLHGIFNIQRLYILNRTISIVIMSLAFGIIAYSFIHSFIH